MNPNFFFIKQKMLGICNFYNRFSISGPFDLSEGSPDGPEPLGAEDGLGAQQEGSIWNFLEPGGLFWVYAAVARRWNVPAHTWCMTSPPTTHRIPYYWKRRDELWPVTTHTKWGASSPKVFVAASTQSKLTSESVAITLSSQLTTKMTNFVVLGCFWTPLKTERKITKF